MQLENSFEVAASSEAAWELLMDVPRVIPCMPGAELVETVDDTHWKARMRVKLGPISLSFLTDVTREEVDEGERRVRLAARAREERGRGAAQATIESSLTPAESGTRVTTVTDLALTGMAAQFGRGLIEDVTAQLLQSFADCLEQQLATSAEDSPEVEPDPPRPVSGLALGAAAMQNLLERHKSATSLAWACFFSLYLFLGMLAVDVGAAEALIYSLLSGGVIYQFIRTCSEQDPALRREWARIR